MILFASDLDNTLIHTYRKVKTGDVCVEVKDGRELSYMSPEARALLEEVAGKCWFVPVTTRSLEQYRRIDLGVQPKYAIVAHGALLLIDGKVDEQWAAETRRVLKTRLPKLKPGALWHDLRYVDEFFIFAKSEDPPQAAHALGGMIDTDRFEVYAVHNKVYVIPIGLNKGMALERLKKRLPVETVIGAGDSRLDLPMLAAADLAIAPESLKLIHKAARFFPDEDFALNTLKTVEHFLEVSTDLPPP